jgi:hypothetical protein
MSTMACALQILESHFLSVLNKLAISQSSKKTQWSLSTRLGWLGPQVTVNFVRFHAGSTFLTIPDSPVQGTWEEDLQCKSPVMVMMRMASLAQKRQKERVRHWLARFWTPKVMSRSCPTQDFTLWWTSLEDVFVLPTCSLYIFPLTI